MRSLLRSLCRSLFWLGLAVFLLVACSAPNNSPACDASLCGGCCTAEGRCEPGTSAQTCGEKGGLCRACDPGQLCRGGACVAEGASDGGSGGDGGALCQPQGQACGVPEQCCDGLTCDQGSCQPIDCAGDRCSAGFGSGGCCQKTPYCGIAAGARVKTCSATCISENRGCGETSDCCTGLVCDGGFCTKAACSGTSCSVTSPCCSGAPYCGGGSTCDATCVGEGDPNGSENACCIGLANSTSNTCERYPFCSYSICTQGYAQGGCCADAPYCTATGNLAGKACLGICGGEGNSCGADTDCCDSLNCRRGRCEPSNGTGCADKTCTSGFSQGGCCESSPVCGAASGTATKCRTACISGGGVCTSSADCCGGRTCTGRVCSSTGSGPAGARCNLNADCSTGNSCVRGLCVAGGQNCSGVSGLCRTSADCCTGTCSASKLCDPPTPTCRTWRQTCNGGSPCCAGLSCLSGYCDYPQSCRTTGATCSGTAPCCAGLSCAAGKCQAPTTSCRSSGQVCSGTSACCPGLACSGAVCTPTGGICRALGGTCSAASPCCVGLSCVGGTCLSPQSSCEGNGCSVGRGAGGCCTSAPYCTSAFVGGGKQCARACGFVASACGSTSDCCSGLNCLQGLCRQGCQGISCRSHGDCCTAAPVCRRWGTTNSYYCNAT